jgi:hypothetical protein
MAFVVRGATDVLPQTERREKVQEGGGVCVVWVVKVKVEVSDNKRLPRMGDKIGKKVGKVRHELSNV